MSEIQERFALIGEIAEALADSLPGDNWHMADAIRHLAKGDKTPPEVRADLEWDY